MKKIFINLTLLTFACAEGIPKKNIGGSDAIVFPKGKIRFVTKEIILTKDSTYNGDREVKDLKDRKFKIQKSLFLLKGGIGYNSEVIIKIPYINKKLNQTIKNRNFDMKNSGLGDISLIGRYSILNQKRGDFAFLSIGGGVKLPTGETEKGFSTPFGNRNSDKTQILQLGSGSYDYILELGFTKVIKSSRVDANINYTFRNRGDNSYQFGDTLNWNLGYLSKLNKIFSIQIELDGIRQEKNRYRDRNIDFTGGSFIYLTPGFQIQFNKKLDLSFGYSRVIKRDSNYDSKQKIGGLSEDYKLLARLGYIF